MRLLRRTGSAIRALFRRRQFEQELDAELSEFLHSAVDAKIAGGLTPDAALRAARLELGSRAAVKDGVRDVGLESVLDGLWRDGRYAVRALRRSPGFAIVAILTLALGIGATTTIYSVFDAILLQPLPYRDADRLVRVSETVPSIRPGQPPVPVSMTPAAFFDWRRQTRTLTDLFYLSQGPLIMRNGNNTAQLWGGIVSADTFTRLGAPAFLGRTLLVADETAPDVVVLGFSAWQRLFGDDTTAVGRPLELVRGERDVRLLTVVGVMPPEFAWPFGRMDFYLPLAVAGASREMGGSMMGRVAPGVSLRAAIDDANLVGSSLPPSPGNASIAAGRRFDVQFMKERMVQDVRPALNMLLAGVGVVLLIVCANVATLLLARATAREREFAIRSAIGANGTRLVRQVLTESLVLSLSGGACGAVLAVVGIVLIKRLAVVDAPGVFRFVFETSLLPRTNEIHVHAKVFGIALGIAALVSLVFGTIPSLLLARVAPLQALVSRSGGTGRLTMRLRSWFAVGQLVMATMLLVGAGLLTRSFLRLNQIDRGYDSSDVVALQIVFPSNYPLPRRIDTIEHIVARLRAHPSVAAVGFSRAGVLIGEQINLGTWVPPGHSLDEMRADPMKPLLRTVGDGYLTAMRFRLLQGRDFEPADADAVPAKAIVSRAVAQHFFGEGNVLGQIVDWHLNRSTVPMEIIGVVADVRNESPDQNPAPEVFVHYRPLVPLLQREGRSEARLTETALGRLSFAIRFRDDAASHVASTSQTVRDVDPNASIDVIIPIDRLVASSIARPRFYMVILSVFAGTAVVLAAIGVYGMLAYAVVRRTPEIGMRIALGASAGQVRSLVLRQGLVLTTMGIGLGLLAAMGGTRFLRSLLFGVTPLDTVTFVTVSVILGIVAAVASYVPAYRATRVNPMVALRSE